MAMMGKGVPATAATTTPTAMRAMSTQVGSAERRSLQKTTS
jgi:hypothetical protein